MPLRFKEGKREGGREGGREGEKKGRSCTALRFADAFACEGLRGGRDGGRVITEEEEEGA